MPLRMHARTYWKRIDAPTIGSTPKTTHFAPASKSAGVRIADIVRAPNDEVERRGASPASNEGNLSTSSTPPCLNEDATRDRSNRLLGRWHARRRFNLDAPDKFLKVSP